MLTIQRSFFADKKSALQHGLDIPVACSKVLLYKLIAQHLGIDTTGIDDHVQIMDMIDAKNIELACADVPMAANIDRKPKPVLRRDRKPVAKPIKRSEIKVVGKPVKRNQKPVYRQVWPNNVMGKALYRANLIEVV